MVIVCISEMVALGSVSEQFTMAGLHLGVWGMQGGNCPPPPLAESLPTLRFYYIYCNVQHVALAPPGMRKPILPPLEQNPKCSPVWGAAGNPGTGQRRQVVA